MYLANKPWLMLFLFVCLNKQMPFSVFPPLLHQPNSLLLRYSWTVVCFFLPADFRYFLVPSVARKNLVGWTTKEGFPWLELSFLWGALLWCEPWAAPLPARQRSQKPRLHQTLQLAQLNGRPRDSVPKRHTEDDNLSFQSQKHHQ